MKATLLFSAGIFAAATAAFTYGDRQVSTTATTPVMEAALLPLSTVIEYPIEIAPVVEVSSESPRIALQAGHWLAAEAPDELAGIRSNGTRGGGKMEWEVNLEIARLAAGMLEEAGYVVDVLPATVPPSYRADLFIAIHADGHNDTSISGFRAASRRDRSGRRGREFVSTPGSEAVSARGREFVEILANEYRKTTNLRRIGDVTRRMENYYAFNSRRFVHSLHPETVGVILETGFLTNASDRRIIVDAPLQSARGIADAVLIYLAPPPSQPAIVAAVP
jgi:N-acetylmuramoyl-L-alanine amidase